MKKTSYMYAVLVFFTLVISCRSQHNQTSKSSMTFEVEMSKDEWIEKLGGESYEILRKKGTEKPFSNKYWAHKKEGIYHCGGCHQPLFDSKTKYDSGTGWPSFYTSVDKKATLTEMDRRYGMARKELLCSRCGGHLGHLFSDGPHPTGLRYCVNSLSLKFVEEKDTAKE